MYENIYESATLTENTPDVEVTGTSEANHINNINGEDLFQENEMNGTPKKLTETNNTEENEIVIDSTDGDITDTDINMNQEGHIHIQQNHVNNVNDTISND